MSGVASTSSSTATASKMPVLHSDEPASQRDIDTLCKQFGRLGGKKLGAKANTKPKRITLKFPSRVVKATEAALKRRDEMRRAKRAQRSGGKNAAITIRTVPVITYIKQEPVDDDQENQMQLD